MTATSSRPPERCRHGRPRSVCWAALALPRENPTGVGKAWWYGYPEVWVYFEVNEGVPESQHRYKWNVQYDFERGYFYVNNNEPGYAAFKPDACPYCKYGKAHPG
mgnify:CR=1 FL=1